MVQQSCVIVDEVEVASKFTSHFTRLLVCSISNLDPITILQPATNYYHETPKRLQTIERATTPTLWIHTVESAALKVSWRDNPIRGDGVFIANAILRPDLCSPVSFDSAHTLKSLHLEPSGGAHVTPRNDTSPSAYDTKHQSSGPFITSCVRLHYNVTPD